jgi:hypothetical protein
MREWDFALNVHFFGIPKYGAFELVVGKMLHHQLNKYLTPWKFIIIITESIQSTLSLRPQDRITALTQPMSGLTGTL